MSVELGIIEGFYGRPWSWEEREETISFLAPHGYRFYMYAPKADPYLRRRWQEDHPAELQDRLAALAGRARETGVRFGVGLTPYELHNDFNEAARQALDRKIGFFNSIGMQDLGILFDDMRGDIPDLAERQVRIVDWIVERFAGDRVIVCPSYYSDDPVLDRVFGARPQSYLEDMGKLLDPRLHVFWTGEEVCSREIAPAHVDRVSEQIRRRPFLWDNYPVNDGERMSQYLHVRAFTGRLAALEGRIAAHGVNPALQPTLSRIPALTLRACYELGNRYAYGVAFREAAERVLGAELGRKVWEDILILQDVGLDRLAAREEYLRKRYEDVNHPGAKEIVAWLDGAYRITNEIVQTQ